MGESGPSAFISYSWDDESHKEWVAALATRLRSDGVDVALDRWSAVPGDQLPQFMERAIRENAYVVIICTPRYKKKSDAREGGVGYEGDVMTAEVMTQGNHRKFIPVLRQGSWDESAPSWLAGKYHVNLSGEPYPDRGYTDLVRTLLNIRETAPPLGQPMQAGRDKSHGLRESSTMPSSVFDDIRITRVIVEEITEPRGDGSAGSALYSIPFALSRRPPGEWAELFVENWNHPPRFTTMHRPGIARVSGSTISLNGTTIDEVERYHRDTLQLATAKTNEQYREWKQRRDVQVARENAQREEHRKHVDDAANRINFD